MVYGLREGGCAQKTTAIDLSINGCGRNRVRKSRSISRVLSRTVIHLGVPLPARSSNLPEDDTSRIMAFCLVLLQMGFSLPLRLPVARCALTAPSHPYLCFRRSHRRSKSLHHFPLPFDTQPLAGILLYGARTFLPV